MQDSDYEKGFFHFQDVLAVGDYFLLAVAFPVPGRNDILCQD
jgi:hypothetical protein